MITITIPGRAIVKKNTKQVVGSGRHKKVIYSKNFREWEAMALIYIKQQWQFAAPLKKSVHIFYHFTFKNKQGEADLSNLIEGPQDALVKAGVIEDDRLVISLKAEKHFGYAPKTYIEITEVEA